MKTTAPKTKVLVLIPTYEEANNISLMIERIMALDASHLNTQIDIFVMDDESPDGTLDIVKKLAKQYPERIFYRSGKKKGLGAAMFKSFGHYVEDFDHDILVTMDADFSHQPEQIIDLVAAITVGKANVAIGSRYIDGGLIPGTWPLSLIIRTRIASFIARWLGGIDNTLHELTTNFRAMDRKVVSNMPYKTFDAKGYGFQMQLVNYLTKNNFDVVEIPIAFHSRLEGESKSQVSDVLEFFSIAYKLNSDSPAKQILRFAAIGFSGIVVNLSALYIMSVIFPGTPRVLLSIIAIQISIISNFILHTKVTFKQTSIREDRKIRFFSLRTLFEFIKYNASTAAVQVLTLTIFATLTQAGIYFILAQLTGIIVAFSVNYYVATHFIWNRRIVSSSRS